MQSLLFCTGDDSLNGLLIVKGGKAELITAIRKGLLEENALEVPVHQENQLVRLVAEHEDWSSGRHCLGPIFEGQRPWLLFVSEDTLQFAGFWNAA